MRVGVSGSSGFIGSALVRALETRGDEVVRLVRNRVSGGASWDPEGGLIDASALEGIDAFVHLAGVGIGDRRWNEEHKARVLDSRVRGTRLLSETLASLRPPPRVLLSASAIGIYGDRGDEVLTEDSEPGTDFLARVCTAWESQTQPAAAAGIRVAIFRSGLVLDPRGGLLARMLIPFKLGLGGRLGSGAQWWSWITLEDEVAALLHLLDSDASGSLNLTAPEPVTNARFTERLAAALRRPAAFPLPARVLRVALGTEMANTIMLASQRVVPVGLEARGFRFAHTDLDGALRALLR